MSGECLLPHPLIPKRRLAAELPLGVFGNGRALSIGRNHLVFEATVLARHCFLELCVEGCIEPALPFTIA